MTTQELGARDAAPHVPALVVREPATISPTTRMAATIRRIGTGKLFLIAAFISIMGAVALGALFQWVVAATGATESSWASLEGITSLVTTALLFGGGIFVYLEYIEAEEARRQADQEAQIAARERQKQEYILLVERLMNEEETAVRRWILGNIKMLKPGDDQDVWIRTTRETIFRNPKNADDPALGHRHIKHVLNTFDSLGFIVLNFSSIRDDQPLMDWLNPMVSKVWERIGPYIEEEARRRNEPNYYLWARRLGQMCIDYRASRNLPASNFVEDAL